MEHEDDTAADTVTEGPDEVIIETPVEPKPETEEVEVPDLTVKPKASKTTKKGGSKQ